MRRLLTLSDSDIFPGTDNKDPADFYVRNAARAVITNEIGNVALLMVGRHEYHKLPGGGVKKHEKTPEALQREIREEIGCSALIGQEIGEIVEYRNIPGLVQTSSCYAALRVGRTLEPRFTKSERKDEFSVKWVGDIEEAIALLEDDQPADYDGMFANVRDLAFLREAKEIL